MRQTLRGALRRFFRTDLTDLPVVSHTFAPMELPNLQIAIEQFVHEQFAEMEVIGFAGSFMGMQDTFSELTGSRGYFAEMFLSAKVVSVQYRAVDIDVDAQKTCVERGIFLIKVDRTRIAALVRRDAMFDKGTIIVEVMSPNEEIASRFLEDARMRARKSSVYRGKTFSLSCQGNEVVFHRFPAVSREEIILPEATMKILERNTLGSFRNAEALRRSGRSVKRGLLLHGKPGTGKTYTAKWLGGSMSGVTVVVLTGEELGLIKQGCQMARMLSPALVILEDVDLIASKRNERQHPMYQITLHQLMNEMDGVDSDAEVIFLLTTNRPEAIESAISMRPGRVDQAIEFPLPDAECRSRLLDLYARGLVLEIADRDKIIRQTDGASPAFIKELARKAALMAAESRSKTEQGVLRVTDAHFQEALDELLVGGGELTRNLLGFQSQNDSANASG